MSTPAELLAMARQLLDRASPDTAGLWPRAAALLGRQALEQAVDDYWSARRIPLDSCPTRQQLICLREYVKHRGVVGRLHHAWDSLSAACHHHAYQLSPTQGELAEWLHAVEGFLGHLDAFASREPDDVADGTTSR